jgi:hypothetical protein
VPKPFDLDAYLRESTAKSGVPLKVSDADVLRDAVAILLAMRSKLGSKVPERKPKRPKS